MERKTETEVIDGFEVKTTQLPAIQSFALFNRLGQILAPAMSKINDIQLDGKSIGDLDVAILAPVLGEVFASINPTDAKTLIREVLASTAVVHEGKLIPLDSDEKINYVFTGRFKAMLKTAAFSLRVNYADFFDFEPEDVAGKEAPTESKSDSTKTSRWRRPFGGSGSKGKQA